MATLNTSDPLADPHWPTGAPPVGGRARTASRSTGQAARGYPAAPRWEREPAERPRSGRRPWDGLGHDALREADQHRLNRAAERDFSQRLGSLGPAWSDDRPHLHRPHGGDVLGRLRLQLLLDPRQPPSARARRSIAHVAGTHSRDGRRSHRSLLDDVGTLALSSSFAKVGRSQASRATTKSQ
jgi:hypothetical protein